MLGNTPNQPSKFKTKHWIKINDESRGTYDKDNQIGFNTSMLRSCLCDYSKRNILVKGTVTVENTAGADTAANDAYRNVKFRNCAPFINCISRINYTQADDVHDIDVVMPIYNLIEYSDNYIL